MSGNFLVRWRDRVAYKWLVAGAFVFGLFMEILDTTIVNVALPRLGQEFQASTAMLEWAVTGYLLSLAIWIPASGWIGDRFGTKRTFLFATLMFIIGSALCGAAWSIESLALFRVLQGVGGGMMTPVGTAMLYRAFTPQERARTSAVLSIPTMVAPMLGPVFGGFLVDKISWRWIFYVNLPVGIASFLFSWFVLREHREEGAGKFDPAGFLLSGFGLSGMLLALSRGVEDGWASPLVLVGGVGGVVCFTLLVIVERRLAAPLLDLGLYGVRLFRTANLVAFTFFTSQFGLVFLLPLYLQQLRGLSALNSGLTTLPQPIGQILMIQVTSRLYARIGPRKNLFIASAGLLLTTCLFFFVGLETNLWLVRGIMFLRGCFIAFNMVAMQTAAFSAVPRAKTGRASSLFSTLRQVGAAFGVAMVGTVLTSQVHDLSASDAAAGLDGWHLSLLPLACMNAIGLTFATRIRDTDAVPKPRAVPAPQRESAAAAD
ncbi:MAG: DHA2 family efflux MFS transporter permease subunit [Chloroflexi bacterium]|nr:DHA2 family efflux MFS transporter permease subunit [Chloroflexota bacterium]